MELNPKFELEKYISAEDIKNEVAQLLKQGEQIEKEQTLFTIKKAKEWLEMGKALPPVKMLFSEFWHEGEVSIMFADTNLGKSALAVQIADSISRGVPIPGFKLDTTAEPVLYFDFELSFKQFEIRYSRDYADHFEFDDNLLRVEINPDAELPVNITFEEFLIFSLHRAVIATGAKKVLVDNLTYLAAETEKAKDASPLMKQLKAIKNKFNLSMLVLAHTPKRDHTRPILGNDLQGSKQLLNLCDSAFAIGESTQDKNMRYIKQIKARNTERIYNTENVCVCQLEKPHNFLQFRFLNYGAEQQHLKEVKDEDREKLELRIRELLDEEPLLSPFVIAKRLGPDEPNFNSFQVRVSRIIKRIKDET